MAGASLGRYPYIPVCAFCRFVSSTNRPLCERAKLRAGEVRWRKNQCMNRALRPRPSCDRSNPDPAAPTMSTIEAFPWVEPGQKALHIKRNLDNVGGCWSNIAALVLTFCGYFCAGQSLPNHWISEACFGRSSPLAQNGWVLGVTLS